MLTVPSTNYNACVREIETEESEPQDTATFVPPAIEPWIVGDTIYGTVVIYQGSADDAEDDEQDTEESDDPFDPYGH